MLVISIMKLRKKKDEAELASFRGGGGNLLRRFFFFFSSRLFLFLDTKNNRLRVSFFFRQAVAQAASRVLFGARFIIMITNGDSSWCLGR